MLPIFSPPTTNPTSATTPRKRKFLSAIGIPAVLLALGLGLSFGQNASTRSDYNQKLADVTVIKDLGLAGVPVSYEVDYITNYAPDNKHHMFGYIGHGLTIPWNKSGRYIVAMRVDEYNRMPRKGETADIILIDTHNDYKVTVVDKTRGFNIQQGCMLYWNPNEPETQFLFNDSDASGAIFTVMYDISKMKRVKEYKFDGAAGANYAIANGGVAPTGEYFAGINYAKTSLRRVLVYADHNDITKGNPKDDGLFKVNIATGKPELIVSYDSMANLLNLDYPVYFHHTLINRPGDRITFVVRGEDFEPNKSFLVHSDGSNLQEIKQSGHPEWWDGPHAVMEEGDNIIFYNVDTKEVTKKAGPFKGPRDDKAYSPDGKWFVVSHKSQATDSWEYEFYRFADDKIVLNAKTTLKSFRDPDDSSTRIDGAPRWNRESNAILVGGVATEGPNKGTRQLTIISLVPDK